MSPVVERNDVDISKLFSWSKESVITGIKGKDITVYIRLLGDADINRVRIMALRRSAEFRRKLRDQESDENLAFIPENGELTKDILIESIIVYTMREQTKRVMKEVIVPKPKDPGSDATTEQLEKYQKEVDEYPKKREAYIRKSLEELIEKQRKELITKEENEVYKLYVIALVNELCEQQLVDSFKEYCMFFATFHDKKMTRRAFNSFDEFDNLPREVKDKLMDEYQVLEIESDYLKK